LNPKRALHIVQVGGQTLLIGATDQSITLISELDPAEQTQTFSSAMQQAAKSQEQS
jgi:flagellar biogenesis protein FliO